MAVCSGYYLEFLRNLELARLSVDNPILDFSFLDEKVKYQGRSPYDFLYGCCYVVATLLGKQHGYGLECVKNETGQLVHAYCVSSLNGEKAYIDIRGITTDSVLFWDEFRWVSNFGELIKTPEVYVPPRGTLRNDSFTRAAKHFLAKHERFYDVEVLRSVDKTASLADRIAVAKSEVLKGTVGIDHNKSIFLNGFYPMQLELGENTNAFFNALDQIEDELPINCNLNDDCFEPASVSVGSFLQGFCGELAMYFHRLHNLPIGILSDDSGLTHVCNVIDKNGHRFYLDARGITDDFELFKAPFQTVDFHFQIFKDISTTENDLGIEWFFPEDEISDAMVSWLLSKFPDYYDVSAINLYHAPRSARLPLQARNK